MFGMFTVAQYISYSVEIYESYSSPYRFSNLFQSTDSKTDKSDSGPYQNEGSVFKTVWCPLRYIFGT